MRKLSRINSILLLLIILVNGYVLLAPLAPLGWFWWEHRAGMEIKLSQQIRIIKDGSTARIQKPMPNTLIVPSMLLNQPILEGTNMYAVLAKGIWHWPYGSTPDRGGNTILIGHRFTYTNPRGVFYFLNNVGVGDEIGITWNNKPYIYRVAEIEVVAPSDVHIIMPTSRPTLTLYTCTPLWLPKDRLVVIAQLEINKL
jgi:LPXTG-site transpeptidase (sortase) family protein